MDHDILIRAALDGGATKATVIPQSQIVLSAMFRDICVANGCGNYGKCWMCPPYVGEIEDLMAQVRRYSHGVLYQTIGEIEDSFDFEGMMDAGYHHAWTSQRIQEKVRPLLGEQMMHISSGCRLCKTCAKREELPCRHPDKALASLESCGVDVYQTTKGTDLKYINGANTVTFFGLVLFSEDEHV